MKRLFLFLAILLTTFSAVLFTISIPVSADVNDFSFSSFDADYYLSKDGDGRSALKVIERLTANFSNHNQNKGIERAIPKFYDGHSVSFQFESLKRNGSVEPLYETREEQGFVVLATGTDEYVNGKQEYTFTYTLSDVTKDFVGHQEFYWDTNGTGWDQQFDNLHVRVHLDDSIVNQFTGSVSCYKGFEGSKKSCRSESSGSVVSFWSDGPLYGRQNLTMNLSFDASTFKGYQFGISDVMPYVLAVAAILMFVAVIYIKLKYGKNHPGRGTIVAEYLPPKNTSLLLAAEISGRVAFSSTAQILDLAVRHKIRIIESERQVFIIGKQVEYTLELLNTDGLNEDEMSFINILFDGGKLGDKYVMSKTDVSIGTSISKLNKLIKDKVGDLGFRQIKKKQQRIQIALMLASALFMVIAGYAFGSRFGDIAIPIVFVSLWLIGFISMSTNLLRLRPLTQSGRELYDYLKGLEMYIELAEVDRIRILQSPAGANKVSVDINNKSKIIVLYERILPYAVLFGKEKEWLRQMSLYYEGANLTPSWYVGSGAFSSSSFASSVGSFSTYSNSSSSSSSSGAGGGGSSGGGGGGGGGGGR
ncbi:DUF2207 domain-containing protein [Candidatus Saccharibacteria bacterium]|nr:DUF2207 domain-containing protein [Candidatus Saccharibacteria bacterium]